jgi:hypothetical protein
METIMGLAARKKQNVEVDQEEDIEGDRIGKVGPWNLWVPTSMERSCKIAQYDPITRAPKTTWCTARTAGSNLFYHYVGRQDQDIVLFYVIKDDPEADEDWLSVGYLNGKPVLKGQRGGLSVTRDNKGLTPETLQAILGDNFDPIMVMLAEKAKEMSGVHPAKEKVRAAARDPELFKKMLKGHSEEENKAMMTMISEMKDISPEVLTLLADETDSLILYRVTHNPLTPAEALEKIVDRGIKTHNWTAPSELADHPNATPELLRKLAEHLPENYLSTVAANPRTPVDVLLNLSNVNSYYISAGLVRNPSLPPEGIENIINQGLNTVKNIPAPSIVENPNITPDQLVRLMDMSAQIKEYALKSPKLPMDVLLAQLDQPISWATRQAYLNPNVPVERLVQFMEDPKNASWQNAMLQNPAMPADILRKWYNMPHEEGDDRMYYMLRNPRLPEDIMLSVAKKGNKDERQTLAGNPGVTDAVLQILVRDRSAGVKDFAMHVLQKRQAAAEAAAVNEAMTRIIRRLIR